MLELFIVGTFWFWALLALGFVVVLASVVNECPVAAFLFTASVLCLLTFCGDSQIFQSVFNNPWKVAAGVLAYAFLGFPWACFKWWLRLLDLRKRRDQGNDWIEKPVLSKNKNRIVTWMMYWPFSLLWTVTSDFIVEFWERVWDYTSGIFSKITDSVWKDLEN